MMEKDFELMEKCRIYENTGEQFMQFNVIGSTRRGHEHCGTIGNKKCTNEEHWQHWNRMMGELMGKQTGYCGGRGGSMHIADVQKGNLGSRSIIDGNIFNKDNLNPIEYSIYVWCFHDRDIAPQVDNLAEANKLLIELGGTG